MATKSRLAHGVWGPVQGGEMRETWPEMMSKPVYQRDEPVEPVWSGPVGRSGWDRMPGTAKRPTSTSDRVTARPQHPHPHHGTAAATAARGAVQWGWAMAKAHYPPTPH